MQAFRIIGALAPEGRDSRGNSTTVVNAVWSPDGRRVALVCSDNVVGIWDGETGKSICRLKGHGNWVLSVCFSPDNKRVLTASEDETARVWDPTTGKAVATLTGHTAGLTDAAFDPSGAKVVTAGEDQTARLWNAATGKQLRVLADHESAVRRVAFDEDGERVYIQTARGVERNWSAADGSLLTEKTPDKERTDFWTQKYDACFLRQRQDGAEIWVGPSGASPPAEKRPNMRFLTSGPALETDDPNTAGMAQSRLSLPGKSWIYSAAIARDGSTLATGEEDQVMVWKPAEWDRVTGKGRTVLSRGRVLSK
jgi:WD40 repeat protein